MTGFKFHSCPQKLEEGVNKYLDNFVELRHKTGANNRTILEIEQINAHVQIAKFAIFKYQTFVI